METLEALQSRIETTRDLQAIVRTMKTLSAVTIRRCERAGQAVRAYDQNVDLGLQVMLRDRDTAGRAIRAAEAEAARGPVGVIVVGSDHGLCGRYNAAVAAAALADIAGVGGGPATIAAVGARAADRMAREGRAPAVVYAAPGSVAGIGETTGALLGLIEGWRRDRGIGRVRIAHNVQTPEHGAQPVTMALLPLSPAYLRHQAARPWPSRRLPTHTEARDALLGRLIREHIFVRVYRALAEAQVSEHASRLTAMQAAERNIRDHLTAMEAEHRRRRQESITTELLDVIAGAAMTERRGA